MNYYFLEADLPPIANRVNVSIHWRLERRFLPGMAAPEAARRKAEWHDAVQRVRSA